jgi:cytochrome c-type biogenesis protein
LVAALAFDRAAARLAAVKRHYRAVQVVSGAILVVFGVLVATGLAGRLSALLPSIDLGL